MRLISFFVLLLAATVAPLARAQETVEAQRSNEVASSPALDERAAVRLRYDAVYRQGAQAEPGLSLLNYGGWTPNHFGLRASVFTGPGWLGGAMEVEREAFTLTNKTGAQLSQGALLRGSLGPVGRFAFGSLRLDVGVAYAFAQLPYFIPAEGNNQLHTPGARHAVEANARLRLELPLSLRLEARGAFPLALAAFDGRGNAVRAPGRALGAALTFPVLRTQGLGTYVVVDFQYTADELRSATEGGLEGRQAMIRGGAGLEFAWLLPLPARPLGGILINVVDAKTGAPVQGARLAVSAGDAAQQVESGADGQARLSALPQGRAGVKVTAPGYLPAEADTAIQAGADQPLTISLLPEVKSGGMVVLVMDKQTGQPVGKAVVTANGRDLLVDDRGQVEVPQVPAGPLALRIRAPGYQPAEEVASVVGGKTSTVDVLLLREAVKLPATLTGTVRSTQGGRSVPALLEIPQAKIKTRATAEGAFTVRIPGGTYHVIISAPGFLSQTKTVTVRNGEQAIFNVDLHEEGQGSTVKSSGKKKTRQKKKKKKSDDDE